MQLVLLSQSCFKIFSQLLFFIIILNIHLSHFTIHSHIKIHVDRQKYTHICISSGVSSHAVCINAMSSDDQVYYLLDVWFFLCHCFALFIGYMNIKGFVLSLLRFCYRNVVMICWREPFVFNWWSSREEMVFFIFCSEFRQNDAGLDDQRWRNEDLKICSWKNLWFCNPAGAKRIYQFFKIGPALVFFTLF